MTESPTITVRIPAWMLAQLRKLADVERRTVGAVIRLLLERQLTATSSRQERNK